MINVKINKRVVQVLVIGFLYYLIFGTTQRFWSSELVHDFGNPSFNCTLPLEMYTLKDGI